MRHYWFALLVLSGAAALAPAQQKAPQFQVGTPEQLAAVMQRWEKEMAAVKTLSAECVRTDVSKTWNYTDVYTGTAKYMKLETGNRVANLALLYMEKKGKPEIFEKFVCTGDLLYQYVPQQKEIRVHKLPAGAGGQVTEDNFLSFLFGMKAEEARRRYDLTLLTIPGDANWIYIDIKPRLPRDKQDFQRAQLVLSKVTFLPRRLWFEEPTGDHHTWDLKAQSGVALKREEFTAPEKPAGWKMVTREPKDAEAQPTLIRPQRP
jgi:TIGR03009 family protein